MFRLKNDEFFEGFVREPDADRQITVVKRGTRAATVKRTILDAGRRNWDWVINWCRETNDEDHPIEVLATWNSLVGELPPTARPAST